MANTLDTLPDVLADRGVTTLNDRALTSLDVFTSDFSAGLVDPKRNMHISVTTDAPDAVLNPTNFTGGDSTVEAAVVTMTQISQQFHLTNAELQDGHTVNKIVDKNWQKFTNKISEQAMIPITAANFAKKVVVATDADIDIADIKEAVKLLPGASERNAVLDWGYFIELTPENRDQFTNADGYAGLDKLRGGNMTGAEAGVKGFVCDPNAIALAARVPYPAGGAVESRTFTIPNLGLTCQANVFVDGTTRNVNLSYDVCLGAVKTDSGAGVRIATA